MRQIIDFIFVYLSKIFGVIFSNWLTSLIFLLGFMSIVIKLVLLARGSK